MTKNSLLCLVAGIVLGIVIASLVASSAVNNQNLGMIRMMGMRQSSNISTSNIDQHFIEQMIPHHDDAITMANLAIEKAGRSEIKILAEDIIKAQSGEISEMKVWYKAWYGKDVPDLYASMGHGMGSGSMHMGMMGSAMDTTKLESADPFDKAFIEEMIPHHQMAVMMAQMLKNSSSRPEMKKLADDIIATQNKEIEQMRAWYSQWYK